MDEITQIKQDIAEIKARNARVETEKAWETSTFRKILIVILTYIVIVLFFIFAKLPKPFLGAIVPAVAFILSTLSIGYFKKIWIKNNK
jgi:polyferredoxin